MSLSRAAGQRFAEEVLGPHARVWKRAPGFQVGVARGKDQLVLAQGATMEAAIANIVNLLKRATSDEEADPIPTYADVPNVAHKPSQVP